MPSVDRSTKIEVTLFFVLAVDFVATTIALCCFSNLQTIEGWTMSGLDGLLLAASATAALLCFMWACRLLAWHKGYPPDFGYIGLTVLGLLPLAILPKRKEHPKSNQRPPAVLYTAPISLLMLAWAIPPCLLVAWAAYSSF